MELILGTAEFGPVGYGEGVTAPPSKQEIIRILNLAWESDIRCLDTSDQYGTEYLEPYFKGFGQIFKSRTVKGAWYHYKPLESRVEGVEQASVYDWDQIEGLKGIIVPLNINNTSFLECRRPFTSIYARSVFDRGRLFKEGYTVKDCLGFIKRQCLTGCIVGVNSVRELEEILKVW